MFDFVWITNLSHSHLMNWFQWSLKKIHSFFSWCFHYSCLDDRCVKKKQHNDRKPCSFPERGIMFHKKNVQRHPKNSSLKVNDCGELRWIFPSQFPVSRGINDQVEHGKGVPFRSIPRVTSLSFGWDGEVGGVEWTWLLTNRLGSSRGDPRSLLALRTCLPFKLLIRSQFWMNSRTSSVTTRH